MEYNYEALKAKRSELEALVRSAASGVPDSGNIDTSRFLDAFSRLTPPQEPEIVFELMTIHSSGRRGGSSRKPGNLLLNWSKLMDLVPDITVAGAGALSSPVWVLPFIGLYVWNKMWRSSEEPLSDLEATIVLALWKSRDSENCINEEIGYRKFIELRNILNLPTVSEEDYSAAINRLVEMDCMELTDGVIRLCEGVRVTY